jgi:hypothetical protein
MMFSVPESYAIEKSKCRVESLMSDNYADPMKLRGGTWFETLLSMAVSKNSYYLNSIIIWSVCKCKRNWKQRPALPCPGRPGRPLPLPLFVRQTAPAPALAALPCPCPCPMSLNRQTPHFLRPETKRYGFFLGYGFQDLDGQIDRQTDRHCNFYIYICCITFALMKCNHCKKE